jgi:thiol-disulfide isomerase/thioredoxin
MLKTPTVRAIPKKHPMRVIIPIFLTLLSFSSHCQTLDSAWLDSAVLSKYTRDTTSFLPSYTFINDKGSSTLLSDFKGKIVYVGVWSTTCAPCIGQFPYQEQLLKRLKQFHLDTAVVFININIEDSKSKWKKGLQKYHPVGTNLHSSDTSLYDAWNIEALPCHILISRSGSLLGKNIVGPGDATIDWLLYSSTKGIRPTEAIWTLFTQDKLMEKYRSSSVFTDTLYSKWFHDFLPALLEFDQWRKTHESRKSR